MKPLPSVEDRWAGGSLTRGPKIPFAVSWSRQLVNKYVILIIVNNQNKNVPALYHISFLNINTEFSKWRI